MLFLGGAAQVLEARRDQILLKRYLGVDEEDPGVLVKRLLEFANIVIIKSIDVKFYYANDLAVMVTTSLLPVRFGLPGFQQDNGHGGA